MNKIIKYNASNSKNSRSGNTTTTIISGGVPDPSTDYSGRLAETHLIFGQPFNGTQDVGGDITNVTNITTEGGDITVKAITDSDGTEGGNITADGTITGNIITGNSIIGESGEIASLQGENISYDRADILKAVIEFEKREQKFLLKFKDIIYLFFFNFFLFFHFKYLL